MLSMENTRSLQLLLMLFTEVKQKTFKKRKSIMHSHKIQGPRWQMASSLLQGHTILIGPPPQTSDHPQPEPNKNLLLPIPSTHSSHLYLSRTED